MWFSAVYSAVQEIPEGRVTSYGHIATLLGYRTLMIEVNHLRNIHTNPRQPNDHDKWACV
jgi:methylated-DNA-protein-cysteine methyltransferase related protein